MKKIGIGMKTLKIYKIDTLINKINMNMSNQIYEKFFVYLPEKIKYIMTESKFIIIRYLSKISKSVF